MLQKVIKVGNSYALTIPSFFVKEIDLKVGDQLDVQINPEEKKMTLTKADESQEKTVELKEWLIDFNKKYKKGLTELAKR